MYEISVEAHFDAAHALRGYKGKCENIHGHRYCIVVRIQASGLDDIGLAYDFTVLKKHLNEVISPFDHTFLNEVPPFDVINPSAENIAATIFNGLRKKLKGDPVTLASVETWESPDTSALYRPD